MPHLRLALVALATVLLLANAPEVRANTVTLVSCAGAQPLPAPWQWRTQGPMSSFNDCERAGGLTLLPASGSTPFASHAKWQIAVPSGLSIRRITGQIRLNQGAGWAAGFYDEQHGGWLYGGPGCAVQCGNGAFTNFDIATDSRLVSFVMLCAASSCNPIASSSLRWLETTYEDPSAPGVALTGGGLASGNWVRGDATVEYRVDDSGGIQRVEVLVDGLRKTTNELACYQPSIPACTTAVEGAANVSTRLFDRDGPHTLIVRATDSSGNVRDVSVAFRADNTAPIPPTDVANTGGTWQATNRFGVRWANPRQADNAAPIAGAAWRLCPIGSSQGCQDGSRQGDNLSAIDDLKVPGPGLWRLQLALRDAAGNTDPANASELVLGYDDTPPDVAIVPTNPDDPTHLVVNASDDVSPIVRGAVEIQRHGSSTWRTMPTDVTSSGLTATIDDEVLTSGDYDVRVHAWNAAGLERSTDTWTTGERALLTLPLRVGTRVRLGAAKKSGSGPRAKTVLVKRPVISYGRRVRLTGQLVAPGGNPLVGVPVQVSSRLDARGAAWRSVAELRTDRSGHFRYRVARGPSREIQFRYSGTATIKPVTRTVRVAVRASTSISVSRHNVVNGDTIRFRGKVRGGHLPSSKRIELQFFARGKWRTFASTRANRRGRWGYTYRFDGSRGTVRWRFRALITPETGYPYATGHSRRVAVTVRGLA